MTLGQKVNCAGCTACCRNDLIVLHPECGDDPAQYETMEALNPLTGKQGIALARAQNGDCLYLDRETGCTIYENRPAICREFSCVGLYRSLDRATRRKAISTGVLSKPIIAAAKARLREYES